ncbi:hypothetical protein INT47_006682 [Mucor saturninus]|uniref:Uncharacterized protein n=1 Tax=Mucor saturninus TaxID=64648 RepID=A0A8H7V114_9FUNG|nr:hypothetical protein INT47_006682 [Mucor saturninus]
MVDRVASVNHVPFSPLRNSSIGFIDDYESGMEASASSMAEEEDLDEDMGEETVEDMPMKKHHITLNHKHPGSKNHRRMSSGNSSTDSNATTSIPPTTKRHAIPLRSEFTSPLQIIQSPASLRLSRKDDIPTPSSGYDGDTEGPLGEDVA